MFIKTLTLENFQSHSKSTFTFDRGLNVLVGVSNSGKSSIARAFSLILFNQWDKSWVSFGQKFCTVSIITDNGIEVIREKGDKVNRYVLRVPTQPEQVYESFGTDVPETIQQALRIHEVAFDAADSLNLSLATQFPSDPFLLSQTGSYRAKILGKLSGATFLDHAIRSINLEKKQTSSEKNSKEAELVEVLTQVDKYLPVEAYASQIAELDSKMALLSTQNQRLERIRGLFERVSAWKRNWAKEVNIETVLAQFVPSSLEGIDARVDNLEHLSKMRTRVIQNTADLAKLRNKETILSTLPSFTIDSVQLKLARTKILKQISANLAKNGIDLFAKAQQLETSVSDHQHTQEEYRTLLEQNGECPTCGASTARVNA